MRTFCFFSAPFWSYVSLLYLDSEPSLQKGTRSRLFDFEFVLEEASHLRAQTDYQNVSPSRQLYELL